MGVEHGLFCHKCKKWVDGHKNWGLYFSVHEHWCDKAKGYVTRPETWDETEKRGRFDWYWTQRMFAFLWNHKDHGVEVEWINDGSDKYHDLWETYEEEWPSTSETTAEVLSDEEV